MIIHSQISPRSNLKWIQSPNVDSIIQDEFPKNIILTSSVGVYNRTIAEHILSLHMALLAIYNL